MKTKKSLVSGLCAVSLASVTAFQVNAVGLGASGNMTEFYYDALDSVEISTEVDGFSDDGGTAVFTAILSSSSFDEAGEYYFKVEPVVDDNENDYGWQISHSVMGRIRYYDIVDIDFFNSQGEKVSAECEINVQTENISGNYNYAFVLEDDGTLTRLYSYSVSSSGITFETPHTSRFVLANINAVPIISPPPENSRPYRPVYTGKTEIESSVEDTETTVTESSVLEEYSEFVVPEPEIGPPIYIDPESEVSETGADSIQQSQSSSTVSDVSSERKSETTGKSSDTSKNTPDPEDHGVNTGDSAAPAAFAITGAAALAVVLAAKRKKAE